MNINWFTVIAQIINFLILIWLLKRFLYKPILKAIDERETKITARIKDTDEIKTKALEEQADYKKRNDDFDTQKKALTDKAVSEAKTYHDKLMEDAKSEVAKFRSDLQNTIKEEQQTQALEGADKLQQQVFSIAKQALKELASSGLEEQSVNTFLKRLHELNDKEKQQFITAFKSSDHSILLKSTFELPANQQTAVSDAVNEILGTKSVIRFETSPKLISGIELSTSGYKLAWNFAEYIQSLQKSIAVATKEKEDPKPALNGKPAAS